MTAMASTSMLTTCMSFLMVVLMVRTLTSGLYSSVSLIKASTALSASPETPPKNLIPAAANAVCVRKGNNCYELRKLFSTMEWLPVFL